MFWLQKSYHDLLTAEPNAPGSTCACAVNARGLGGQRDSADLFRADSGFGFSQFL